MRRKCLTCLLGRGPFGGAGVVPFRLSRPVEKHQNNGNPFFRRVRTYVRKEDYGRVRTYDIYNPYTKTSVSHIIDCDTYVHLIFFDFERRNTTNYDYSSESNRSLPLQNGQLTIRLFFCCFGTKRKPNTLFHKC